MLKPTHLQDSKAAFIKANADDFIKPVQSFLELKEIKISKEEISHHSAKLYSKKPKETISKNLFQSQKRDKNKWYGITNTSYISHDHVYPIIMACSAIARFIGGDLQPKYRYDPKSKILFSKGIPFVKRYDQVKGDFETVQRIGTDTFIHYLLENNDLNAGNCLVNSRKKYFVAIDYDRCLPSVMFQYIFVDPVKWLTYDIGDHIKKKIDDDLYCVENVDECFMGEMTVRDYDNLPFLRDQVATTWHFMNIFTEMQKTDEYNPFKDVFQMLHCFLSIVNEKHFAALITKLSIPFLLDLVDIHIKDEKDNNKFKEKILERFDKKLEMILLASEGGVSSYGSSVSFKQYLKTYPVASIKAVLYHINRFFTYNRHYHGDWKLISKEIIKRFSDLWKKLFNETLSINPELEKFAAAIQNNSLDALSEIKKFYNANRMALLVEQIESESKKIFDQPFSTLSIFKKPNAVVMTQSAKNQSGNMSSYNLPNSFR